MGITSLLDERYHAVALANARFVPARIGNALALGCLAYVVHDLRTAVLWACSVLTLEVAFLMLRRAALKGGPHSPALLHYFLAICVALPVWSTFGVLMWLGDSQAAAIGAVAYWCGHLLYVQTTFLRSPLATWQALPISVALPFLVPLLAPRFTGLEQAVVMALMTLFVAHAAISALFNIRASRRLDAASEALTREKVAAETAQAEMAVARAEAEQASQAKSDFLAAISHEIRTPLNGVLGMAQAMSADVLSDVQRERLKIVSQSGEALLATLNDVLDLSKVEAGLLEIETIDFDLPDLMRGALGAFSAVAERKGLSLVADLSVEGGYRGDPARLRQILHNLISNAVKFTDAGEVRMSAEESSTGVVITVSDTGLGIPAEAVDRVFDAFTQADASTTRRYGGSGLGLTICRELARRMGGEISVDSRQGEGTRFRVVLPMPKASVDPQDAVTTRDARPAADLRVLVAEDNPVNQLVIRTLLGQVGISPHVVDDGAQAVQAWRTGHWDVVLMDVQMPVMDGPTAARAIRTIELEERRARTPILALTANAMTHQVESYVTAGMDGYIAKPIKVEALYAALEQALSQEQDQDTAVA